MGVALIIAAALAGTQAIARESRAGNSSATVVGRLYTETNAKANQVIVLDRHADGTLAREQAVSTGGAGGAGRRGCKTVEVCPFVDSEGQIDMIQPRHLLFAVNAGSDTVSSFRVTAHGLKLVDQQPSGGRFPDSVTAKGNLVYVVNTGSLSVTGFRVSAAGKLTPIRGDNRKLDSHARPGTARQIGLDNRSKLLAVTLLNPAEIETFRVSASGALGAPRKFQTNDTLPFGFVFDSADRMVVTQIHDFSGPHGTVAVYKVTASSGAAKTIDLKPASGFGPCWIVLATGSRFVYVVNTGAGTRTGATIAAYQLSGAGVLTQIQVTSPLKTAAGKPEYERTNALLSSDGRYLYVLVPGRTSSTSRLDIYAVRSDGKLTLSGETPSTLAPGISGLAGG